MRKATTRAVPCSNRAVPHNRALQGEDPIMAQVAQVVRASPTGMTTVRTRANPAIRTRALAHIRIWSCMTVTAVAGQARNSRAGTKTCTRGSGHTARIPLPHVLPLSFQPFPLTGTTLSSSFSGSTPASPGSPFTPLNSGSALPCFRIPLSSACSWISRHRIGVDMRRHVSVIPH